MKRVYVIIVNWNGWEDTIECLESVFRLNYPDLRVIVCDNASTDNSVARIEEWAVGKIENTTIFQDSGTENGSAAKTTKPIATDCYDQVAAESGGDRGAAAPLVIISLEKNLGFAGGNNVGLRYALSRDDFEYAWLLNNDTVVEPGALSALTERMEVMPAVGMCGSTLINYYNRQRIQACGGWYCKWLGLPWHIGQLKTFGSSINERLVERWMNYVVGASLLISKNCLNEIGLLCEDYFLFFEEIDWATRARGKYRLGYAAESRVFHKIGRSIGTSSNPRRKSLLCDFYYVRNRLLFTRKFYPLSLPGVYLTTFAALFLRLFAGRTDLVSQVWKILLGKMVYDDRKAGTP